MSFNAGRQQSGGLDREAVRGFLLDVLRTLQA
jgi:hypothetical protein